MAMTKVSSILTGPMSKALTLLSRYTTRINFKQPKRAKTLENLENHKEYIIQGDKNDRSKHS